MRALPPEGRIDGEGMNYLSTYTIRRATAGKGGLDSRGLGNSADPSQDFRSVSLASVLDLSKW